MKKQNNDNKKIDNLSLSIMIQKQPTVENTILAIDEDTSFDIIYDVYDGGDQTSLYIKLQEVSATSPFFYNRSFLLKELHKEHKLFKICDYIEEVKDELKKYFEAKVVRLEYGPGKETVLMIIDVTLGVTKYKVSLELYKEMIPDSQKESTLLELYDIQKSQLIALKEILALINEEKKNNKETAKALTNIFKKREIPGIELIS